MEYSRFLKPLEVEEFRSMFIDGEAEMRLEGENLIVTVDWRPAGDDMTGPPQMADVAQVPLQDVIVSSAHRILNLSMHKEDLGRAELWIMAGQLRELASHIEHLARDLNNFDLPDPKFDEVDNDDVHDGEAPAMSEEDEDEIDIEALDATQSDRDDN